MEFVIEKQILDILSTLCQADIPPGKLRLLMILFTAFLKRVIFAGLRPHIIRNFIFFMTHIKQTILPYVGVYLPIRYFSKLNRKCKINSHERSNSEKVFCIDF